MLRTLARIASMLTAVSVVRMQQRSAAKTRQILSASITYGDFAASTNREFR